MHLHPLSFRVVVIADLATCVLVWRKPEKRLVWLDWNYSNWTSFRVQLESAGDDASGDCCGKLWQLKYIPEWCKASWLIALFRVSSTKRCKCSIAWQYFGQDALLWNFSWQLWRIATDCSAYTKHCFELFELISTWPSNNPMTSLPDTTQSAVIFINILNTSEIYL